MNVFGYRAERIVGILVSVIFAFFAFSSLANAADEYEPNDTRGEPAGPVAPGQTLAATLEDSNDSDWYKFFVSEPDTLVKFTATRTNGVAEPWHVEFVYENGDAVDNVTINPPATSAELSGTVQPGKYFAWVIGNPETDTGGLTYTLSFTQGLSDFQAIRDNCTIYQGRVDAFTPQLAAAAELVARANKSVAKANADSTCNIPR